MSQHWSTMKEAGALSGMRFLIGVYKFCGRTVFSVILAPVMVYFFIRRTEARRASIEYLKRVRAKYPESLPGRSITWLSFRHFLAFGNSLLDKYIAWSQSVTDVAMDPDEEEILFESKYHVKPKTHQDTTGLAPDSQTFPAVFVKNVSSENVPFSFGGTDQTNFK